MKYKYYVSKFHLFIKLTDEQTFLSIINVIINHEYKVNGFEMKYYKGIELSNKIFQLFYIYLEINVKILFKHLYVEK